MSQEKYRRLQTVRPEEPIKENEIRVTAQGKVRRYISYATSLLQQKKAPEITLKAMGHAISKTVAIAELLKRRISGLHQVIEIGSSDVKDVFTPQEQGLETVELVRHVSSILIRLARANLDTSHVGYQAPLPEIVHSRGRGRGRGFGRGRSRGRGTYTVANNSGSTSITHSPSSPSPATSASPAPAPSPAPVRARAPAPSAPLPESAPPGEGGYGRGRSRGRGRGRGRGGRGRGLGRGRGDSSGDAGGNSRERDTYEGRGSNGNPRKFLPR